MTVPITGITPIYGIEYLLEGEPVRNTRAKLERNAKQIEAALNGKAIPPPAAADWNALVARVAAVEPTAWITPSLNSGYTNLNTTLYHPIRYRRIGGHSVQLVGTAGPGAAGVMFTLQAGYRPAKLMQVDAIHEGGVTRQVDIGADGQVNLRFAATSFLAINTMIPLT
jgi:hypothetical protein